MVELDGFEASVEVEVVEVKAADFRGLVIGRKTDRFCHLALKIGRLWFSGGTCKRFRIFLCISWRSDDNPAQLVSWKLLPTAGL